MSLLPPVYVVSAARTPIGAYLGSLSSLKAPELGAVAIKAALERAGVAPELIGHVFMGNVLSAGIGQAPARQALRGAGIPDSVQAVTVSKVCGSGMEALIQGARTIALGDAEIVVAGGMESMSNVPYYLDKGRQGYRMGNATLIDGMIHDGLLDPYANVHMGTCGDKTAAEYKVSREAQDEFAKDSFRKALSAQKEGLFDAEIAPVSIAQKKGDALLVKDDEGPAKGNPDKIPTLKPAFSKDGTITAANASSINDGASALILASEAAVKKHNLKPSDIDLFEINEAFAVVPMVCTTLSKLDPSRVNVRGGAVALGHPIGASGARIVTTLLHAMKSLDKKRGMASICIGGGEALVTVFERV